MVKIHRISVLIVLVGLSLSQPARGQVSVQEQDVPAIEFERPGQKIPPISLPHSAPRPPFDPRIAEAIHQACCEPTDHVQIQLVSGLSWKGRVTKLREDDTDSFDLRLRGTKMIVKFEYRELASVNRIGPSFEEGVVEGLRVLALGAGLVALIPVGFAIGLGCGFQCS